MSQGTLQGFDDSQREMFFIQAKKSRSSGRPVKKNLDIRHDLNKDEREVDSLNLGERLKRIAVGIIFVSHLIDD